MEIQIQELSWYEKLAQRNHRGLVAMTFLVNAMPYRVGEVAGFVPSQARAMHAVGDAVPYFKEGEALPAVQDTGIRASETAERSAEIERLNGIELSAAIYAEDKLAQIAMAKRIKGVDPKSKMTLEEATEIIRVELTRREAAEQAAATGGALTSQTARATLPQGDGA